MNNLLWKYLVIVGLIIISIPAKASGNDAFEKKNNFYVSTKGNGVLHFKVLEWSKGGAFEHNHWADDDTHLDYYIGNDESHKTSFLKYWTSNGKNTDHDSYGTVHVKVLKGQIVLTNRYQPKDDNNVVSEGEERKNINVKAETSNLDYLEFDWYPPSDLADKTIGISMSIDDHRTTFGHYDTHTYTWSDFQMKSSLRAAQLYSPIFYPDTASAYAGYLAVPYFSFDKIVSYRTCLNPDKVVSTQEYSGNIYIPASDEVRPNFYITTKSVWYDENKTDVYLDIQSESVTIPAYHKIYNFKVESYTPSWYKGVDYGYKRLTWEVINPWHTDILPNDVFEIQRAYKSDFSDAVSIGTINYVKLDSVDVADDIDKPYVYEFCDTTVESTYNSVKAWEPIYYRVRRASSYYWGWKHDFAASGAKNMLYLITQSGFDKNATIEIDTVSNFSEDRTIRFTIPLTNILKYTEKANPESNIRTIRSIWDERTNLILHRKEYSGTELINTVDIFIPTDSVQYDTSLQTWVAHFTDKPTRTYVRNEYSVDIDTRNTRLPLLSDELACKYFNLSNLNNYNLPEYSMSIDIDTKKYNDFYLDHVARVTNLGASKGFYNDKILIKWGIDAGESDYFIVERKSPNSSTWETLSTRQNDLFYVDKNCGDNIYTYRITSVIERYGERHTAQATTTGWCNQMGSISGNVQFTNGIAQAGITVSATVEGDMPQIGSLTAVATNPNSSLSFVPLKIVEIPQQGTVILSVRPGSIDNGKWNYYNGPIFSIGDITVIAEGTESNSKIQIFQNSTLLNEYIVMPTDGFKTISFNFDKSKMSNRTNLSITAAPKMWIGEVQIWSKQLGTEDIKIASEYTLSGKEEGLVAYYPFGLNKTDGQFFPNMVQRVDNDVISDDYTSDNTLVKNNYDLRVSESGATATPQIDNTTENGRISIRKLSASSAADGSYTIGGIVVTANGQKYSLTAESQYGKYIAQNGSTIFSTVITREKPTITDVNFYNDEYVRLSGRVLYQGTTVPVVGATFRLDNIDVKNANGSIVRTNESGNFSISVPKNKAVTIQAVMSKHTFADDGYVLINDKNQISLDKNLDGVRIYDATRVRLIGRLVGGNTQGDKTLGLGLSSNNLGDDLQMVFAVEGDNTAHLVNNPDDLSETERDEVYKHFTENQQTKAHYDTKRIIVTPDITTGEYIIDLLPIKYKITQATARGYASLLPIDAGIATLDLTNCLDTLYQTDDVDKSVPYNAIYNIIYRSPISLTYKQLQYGQEVAYYGERYIRQTDMADDYKNIEVARQTENGIKYLFDYPIFDGTPNYDKTSRSYEFKVSAHEDYYYNNDKIYGKHEQVMIQGAKLKINNGLNKKETITTDVLDLNGERNVKIEVNNTTFMFTGDDALLSLDMSAEINGEHVQAPTLRAYVLGTRTKGTDIVGSDIMLNDVLRDPPGSASNAWLEAGSTYASTYSITSDFKAGISIGMDIGSSYTSVAGVQGGTVFSGLVMSNSDMTTLPNIDLLTTSKNKVTTSYSFTTTDRITTSSADTQVGAEADVYIGTEIVTAVNRNQSICIIPEETRQRLLPAIRAGEVKIISTAIQENGDTVHFAIAEDITFGALPKSTFAYTQKHILKNLIPSYISLREALLSFGTEAEVQAVADATGKVQYYSRIQDIESDSLGLPGTYIVKYPKNWNRTYCDSINAINHVIESWENAIATNEMVKISAIQTNAPMATYELSAGVSRQYTETATASTSTNETSVYPFGIGLRDFTSEKMLTTVSNWFFKFLSNMYNSNSKGIKVGADNWQSIKDIVQAAQNRENGQPNELNTATPGASIKFKITPTLDLAVTPNEDESNKINRQVGFKLEEGNHGNISVSVYRVINDEILPEMQDIRYDSRTGITDEREVMKNEYSTADFVYYLNGGATRTPWEDETYTYFYIPGTKLSNRTLKIDNPTIKIDRHEINDVPQDGAAYFDLTLSNESEVANYETGIVDKQFLLTIDNSTNPYGAKLYVDGVPIDNGISMVLTHNIPIHKILEVRRGNTDDCEDIMLWFQCANDPRNHNTCSFSVHFSPSSCDVNIAAPTDKWIMNTLSPRDSSGYYLPVKIDGFDVNYKNFDHIEFQYKLSTQPDNEYINLCSFFANDSLYNAASGNKAMITSSCISDIHFYGEHDPIEQQYDLRAVSFCRLGSKYVSKSSKVISGTKDTRLPRLFGSISPKNNVLGIGEFINIPFSENIAGNYLDEDNNFQITGYTNAIGITATTSLQFDGSGHEQAQTAVTRNLSNKDFTIDMMVKPDYQNREMIYLSQGSSDTAIRFGQTAEGCLFLQIGDERVVSSKLEPMLSWTRVVATYSSQTGKVNFYAGSADVSDGNKYLKINNLKSGNIFLGNDISGSQNAFCGLMLETRLWTKALTKSEIAETNQRYLTGYEHGLLAYYPLNEGVGNIANDKAHGANIILDGPTWRLPSGLSLYFDGKNEGVQLDDNIFSRPELNDYTLTLWFKADTEQTSDTVALFAAGRGVSYETLPEDKLFIGLEKSNVVIRQNNTYEIAEGNYCDNAWHQIALTVNRAYNIASLYIDNNLTNQFDADKLGGIISDNIWIGNCHWSTIDNNGNIVKHSTSPFHGYIDDITLWETALPQNYLSQFSNTAPNDDEMGLLCHLAFNQRKQSSSGIFETEYNPYNCKIYRDENQKIIDKKVRLVKTDDKIVEQLASNIAAPIRDKSDLTKMKFSWLCHENELVVNLDMLDREINKQNIFISVRDVEDLAGNKLQDPLTWSIFVDRNQLKWSEKYIQRKINYGITDKFTLDIVNLGGTTMNYTIEDLPSWLSTDNNQGSLAPIEQLPVDFYIDENLDPGEYSSIIYLTDNYGLSEPLLVSITVEATAPQWTVDTKLYNETMNFIGKVQIAENTVNGQTNTYFDTDKRDIVAAFVGNTCVGVQNLDIENSLSNLYMTIYGNSIMTHSRTQLTFRLWRASTGKTYSLDHDGVITFKHNTVVGSPEEPIILSTNNNMIQPIKLQSGWNWISFYIKPFCDGNDFSSSFLSNYDFTPGDIIKTNGMYAEYTENLFWAGTLEKLSIYNSYMIRVEKEGSPEILGSIPSSDEREITLHNKWNYLPFLSNTTQPIDVALADYLEKATEGDVIKSYRDFAIFSDGKWIGSLTHLRPGEGYLIYRQNTTDAKFRYFENITANKSAIVDNYNTSNIFGKYSDNMPIVAIVNDINGTSAQQGDILQAWQNGELVGETSADEQGRFFLMTSAGKSAPMSFSFISAANNDVSSTQPILPFNSSKIYGSIEHPYIINFEQIQVSAYPNPFAEEINFNISTKPDTNIKIEIFDSRGALILSHYDISNSAIYNFNVNNVASLPSGIYVANVNVGDKTFTIKLIKR